MVVTATSDVNFILFGTSRLILFFWAGVHPNDHRRQTVEFRNRRSQAESKYYEGKGDGAPARRTPSGEIDTNMPVVVCHCGGARAG